MTTFQVGYNGGHHPDRDRGAFVDALRKKYPGITDYEIRYLFKQAVARHDQHNKGRIVALFGGDIMTANPQDIPAWPFLARSQQERVLAHPHVGGEVVDGENKAFSQLELARGINHGTVNRSVLISPPGLQRTYVWREATDWVQEMTEHDYLLVRQHPTIAHRFQRMDTRGPIIIVRSYDMVAKERYTAKDMGEVEALKREFTMKPHFKGLSLES